MERSSMARNNWREAVADIQQTTRRATDRQHRIAAIAGIALPKHMPQLVAAARLQNALGADIGSTDESYVNEVQEEILTALKTSKLRITTPPRNSEEARAWIAFLRLKRRKQALTNLKLMTGDIVEVSGINDANEVSSIGSNGRVYFKGSGGGGAWPDQLTVLCRKDDTTKKAGELKRKAINSAALRARIGSWTLAKQDELKRFEVTAPLTLQTVQELERVIEAAQDEAPIQGFIEKHPETLAALLGGAGRFVLPDAV
jgi:hypothetical protein